MEIETITAPPVADSGGSVVKTPETPAKQPDSGVQKQEAVSEKKYRLKYGKTEREVSEKELIAEAQKGWAADDRFKEAAAMKREVKDAIEKGDLEFLVRKMKGKDTKTWAKELLINELRKAQMSPEEKEASDRQSRIEALKKEEEDLLTKRAAEKLEARTKHYEDQYDRDFTAALQKHGLPKNKYVMGRAVQIASEVVDMGLEPDWDLVVGEAKRQTQAEFVDLFGQLEDYGIFGEEVPKKIAKWLQTKGMPKKESEKEAVRLVKQQKDDNRPDTEPVDSETYWEKKRKAWEAK